MALTETAPALGDFEAMLRAERPRLVRLCRRLTGSDAAAEDVAQETLLEAWRHADMLTDATGASRWLAAIARNVALRWARRQGRDAARLVPLEASDATAPETEARLAEPAADVTLELERDELARLLDRALALLPAETRQVLIARCVEESPQAEVAARLGVSEGAVAVRLQRGKLALRRVLAGELRAEAADFGMFAPGPAGWQETRIWCTTCGRQRLRGTFSPTRGELVLRCPRCWNDGDFPQLHHISYCGLLDGVAGFKPALTRVVRWAGDYYRRALDAGQAPCTHCGQPAPLRAGYPADHPFAALYAHGFHIACARCGYPENNSSLDMQLLALPEGLRFWRQHERLRPLPVREVEAHGQPALVAGFESVLDRARLEAVVDRARYTVLEVHTTACGAR
jgi:RNA polymerase sigma factor (sigma-70 family)